MNFTDAKKNIAQERIQKLVDSEENDALLLEARKSQATEREQN